MKHDFDWATAPQPWNWIGMQWAAQVRGLVNDMPSRAKAAEVYRLNKNEETGTELKRRRSRLGLTQAEVARAAGIHPVYVSRVELCGAPVYAANKMNEALKQLEAKHAKRRP